MADGYASVEVRGLKELNEALRQLPDRIARNVLRGATSAGAAVIRKEAKVKAPVYTGQVSAGHPPPGTLRRAVYQKQIRELSSLVKQTFYVGVRVGRNASKKGLDAFYWRFIEFGTSKQPARPFLRPAFETKKLEAIAAIKQYLTDRIPKEVDKLKKGPTV